MSDDPFTVHPFFNTWVQAQEKMLQAQAPFWKQMSSPLSSGNNSDLVASTEKFWIDAQKQGHDWINQFATRAGFASEAEGIAKETLEQMMDPGQFMFAGADEVNQTVQKLVEGSEYADLATLENRSVKSTQEWAALREANAAYKMVTIKAWNRAFKTFTDHMIDKPKTWADGPTAITRLWLSIANDELIKTQRTDEFLSAQRNLLRAGVDYRLRERQIMEQWCETHSMPTRSEIDDLHEIVHTLRREVRHLKRTIEASTRSATDNGATT